MGARNDAKAAARDAWWGGQAPRVEVERLPGEPTADYKARIKEAKRAANRLEWDRRRRALIEELAAAKKKGKR